MLCLYLPKQIVLRGKNELLQLHQTTQVLKPVKKKSLNRILGLELNKHKMNHDVIENLEQSKYLKNRIKVQAVV